MDQDLSLMKSLLTLNEAIEDLKWQKKYYHSEDSVPDSSCNLVFRSKHVGFRNGPIRFTEVA